jgi:hypothetical protein
MNDEAPFTHVLDEVGRIHALEPAARQLMRGMAPDERWTFIGHLIAQEDETDA